MNFDNEPKLLSGSKDPTVFRRVELEDLSKLALLDEAIILKSDPTGHSLNEAKLKPVTSDKTGPPAEREKSSRGISQDWLEDGGATPFDTMTPVPLIPISMMLVALIVAAIWTSA
ncbi:MAG: hypothetical protein V1897_04990 [Pseudomonadota bacterium]